MPYIVKLFIPAKLPFVGLTSDTSNEYSTLSALPLPFIVTLTSYVPISLSIAGPRMHRMLVRLVSVTVQTDDPMITLTSSFIVEKPVPVRLMIRPLSSVILFIFGVVSLLKVNFRLSLLKRFIFATTTSILAAICSPLRSGVMQLREV